MFRCRKCNLITKDVDQPPCETAGCKAPLDAIATIHHHRRVGEKIVITCLGKSSNLGLQASGSRLAVTCTDCQALLSQEKEGAPAEN